MKKVRMFLKNSIKLFIGLIIGGVVSGIIVYAESETLFAGRVVEFDNTKANLTLNGQAVDNVQDALDALYEKAANFTGCPSGYTKYNETNKGYLCTPLIGIGNSYVIPAASGLVAVKTDGTLYTGSGTIREYRYSGGEEEVNNWITFNGENWRIIGFFDDDGDEKYAMRIIREQALGADVPSYYTTNVNGSSYQFSLQSTTMSVSAGIHSSVQPVYQAASVYWNSGGPRSGYNDWAQAGLQFYLNDEDNTSSWYYNNFKKSGASGVNYEQYIDTSTWYLRTITVDSSYYVSGTPSEVYNQEHISGSVYSGNQATWEGKVGLLYVSDYGYAADYTLTSSWSAQVGYYNNLRDINSNDIKTNNWLLGRIQFFSISPSSYSYQYVPIIYGTGNVGGAYPLYLYKFAVRPVLSLESNTPIISGTGAYNDPYKIIAES